jgi:hypothetical protein
MIDDGIDALPPIVPLNLTSSRGCGDGILCIKMPTKTELVYFEKYNGSIQIVNNGSFFFFIFVNNANLSMWRQFQLNTNFKFLTIVINV